MDAFSCLKIPIYIPSANMVPIVGLRPRILQQPALMCAPDADEMDRDFGRSDQNLPISGQFIPTAYLNVDQLEVTFKIK
jgi:hypothetical protein